MSPTDNIKDEGIECCDLIKIHQDAVHEIQGNMPEESLLDAATDLFKAFGDPTRMKILFALAQHEICVCDLAAILNMTQSAVSHQLRVLKNARLIKNRREGKTVFYSLADDHVKTIVKQGFDHVTEGD